MNQSQCFEILDQWITQGWLRQLDKAFAGFLQTQASKSGELVLWAGALLSQQLGRGEVYLDLEKLSQEPGRILALPDPDSRPTPPSETEHGLMLLATFPLSAWQTQLSQSTLVGMGVGNTPLVLEGNRLYLRRYWHYQQILNQEINSRLLPSRTLLPTSLQPILRQLFGHLLAQPDWQKIACVLALRARFAIITGGPGTGKTTTLTKLLSLLISLAEQAEKPGKLTILLAAPTGKAAARVSESIAQALQQLALPESIKQQIPKKASTLHRLLGSRPDSRRFKHGKHNPLLADMVIVDEASMIDLEMMANLLLALPASAQLILLGDKDQLASVEAGSVMGDLCRGADFAAYDHDTLQWIAEHADVTLPTANTPGSAINQQTVMLRYSHRFGEQSGIGQLARAVNSGQVEPALAILNDVRHAQELQHLRLSDNADPKLQQLIVADASNRTGPGYGAYLNLLSEQESQAETHQDWAIQVLQAFDSFQVLCSLRHGDWGVEGMNQRIEQWLFPSARASLWYAGRPVMITRNDYHLGLMNGDIGLALPDIDGKLRVAFPGDESHAGKVRWVSPMRLPDVETAFAMTVHKAQGSEFNHVALILPAVPSPVLSRELIYTGITRAKQHFSLLESQTGIFAQCITASYQKP